MNEDQPIRPANIESIVAINQGSRPLTMETPRARPLKPAEGAQLLAKGCIAVDARSSAAFGSGHVPGALNVQLASPEFEQRVGWIAPPEAPLLLVVGEDGDADRALFKMAFIGLDARVEGYLAGGMDAWVGAGMPQASVPQLGVRELHERIAGVQVLDVRPAADLGDGRIAGSHHLDYRLLPERLDELGLAREAPLAAVCTAGFCSSTACSVLLRGGFTRVSNVAGGVRAWSAAGLELA